jgi:AraC-like DNA-binding protein
MNYIIILGAFQALVALGLLMVHRQKRPADHLLTWMLLCIFTHLCIKFAIYGFPGYLSIKAGFNTFLDLAYGPILWMYTCKLHNSKYHPFQQWYLLLPTLLAAIVYLAILFYIITGGNNTTSLLFYYNYITQYAIIVTSSVLPVLSLWKASQLADFWQAERRLIRKIAIAFIAMAIVAMAATYLIPRHVVNNEQLTLGIRIVAYTLLLLISLAILQYKLASGTTDVAPEEKISEPQQPQVPELHPVLAPVATPLSIRRSALTEEQQATISGQLTSLMEKKKVYTDPELTLEKLAALIKIPRHHLSETLNQSLGKSFYQFINDFRITEVLFLLDKCKQQGITPGILSLAFEAGFNSKSSFNQYFKKTTGLTPSEYLKRERMTEKKLPAGALVTFS